MNYSFLEERSKEKVKNLLDEGQHSQAFHRSGAKRISVLRNLPKLMFLLIGILGLILLFVR